MQETFLHKTHDFWNWWLNVKTRNTYKQRNIDRIRRILDISSFWLSLKSPVVECQNVNIDRNVENFISAWGQEAQANNNSVKFIKFIATINIFWLTNRWMDINKDCLSRIRWFKKLQQQLRLTSHLGSTFRNIGRLADLIVSKICYCVGT